MAGEQDILSLGLDISSFNTQKIKILNEYITLFDTLSKYDGKIFNPVMGDGLTKFNTSIAETNRLVDELNTKLNKLNTSQVKTKIFPTKEVQDYSNETKKASDATNKLSANTSVANVHLENIGRSLTRNLGYLRTIAYILPGIGLAGIFNLAFEAISNVGEGLGITTDKISKTSKETKALNDEVREQIELYAKLNKEIKEFNENFGKDFIGGGINQTTYKQYSEGLEVEISKGLYKDKELSLKIDNEKYRVQKATFDLRGKSIEQLKSEANGEKDTIKKSIEAINSLNQFKDKVMSNEVFGAKRDKDFKKIDTQIEEQKSIRELAQARYDEILPKIKEYYESIQSLKVKEAEYDKFADDEERKRKLEFAKDDIALELDKNKKILDDASKFHSEKDLAIRNSYEKEIELNKDIYENVKSNRSLNSQKELDTAENKLKDDNAKAQLKRDAALEKNDIEFYQRSLKTKIEVQKNEVDITAINNEKIEQNENSSLEDRLNAYSNYITEKSKLQDLEFELASSAGKSSLKDKTGSLTDEEIKKLQSDRDKEILVSKADAEAKVYNIVYSSLQKQLKAIVDEGEIEGSFNNEQLIKDLNANNEKYKNKTISLKRYLYERKKILEIDERESLQRDIDDDEKQRVRLLNLKNKTLEDLKKSQDELDKQNSLSDSSPDKKYKVDTATGKVKGYQKELDDINKEIAVNDRKSQSDRLKQAKIGYDDDHKLRNQWIDAALEVEKKLYNSIIDINAAITENRIKLVERQKELLDEQIDNEKDAVEKSTLTLKDKQAIEIQLSEQKRENDINAQKEEKRLRVEEAEFNKKLAISNAVIGISAAIIRDGLTTPKSIADAIIGGIELAKILVTPIPSYRKGTDFHKGGLARFAEENIPEVIKEPGKKPWIALTETIKDLPKGTKVIPLNKEFPSFENEQTDESWEQTRYLGRLIKKGQKETVNIFKPNITIDISFEVYKKKILGN